MIDKFIDYYLTAFDIAYKACRGRETAKYCS